MADKAEAKVEAKAQSAAEKADARRAKGREQELARQKKVVEAVAEIDFSKMGGTILEGEEA